MRGYLDHLDCSGKNSEYDDPYHFFLFFTLYWDLYARQITFFDNWGFCP